jgi:D-alanyl-D-alanine carboxypeptidase (penicillin-binding protein 5/6)
MRTAVLVASSDVRRASPPLLAIVVGLSALLFVLFAALVPPGLPYDEPSHFGTVEQYAQRRALPVMGDPGVTYEAQNGPVYYASSAAVYEVADGVAGRDAGFYVVRLATLPVWLATLGFTYVLLRRLLTAPRAIAALAIVALNPAILAVVASVQNDALSMLLCLVALVFVAREFDRRELRVLHAAVFGLLAGLAALTKLHTLFVTAPAAVVLFVRARRDRVKATIAGGAAFLVVAGWWFAWNRNQYGDLTGRAGVRRTGVEFPAEELTAGGMWRFARGVFGYLWTPAEYFRNTVDTPVVFEALAVLLTSAAVLGLVMRPRRPAPIVTAYVAIAATFCLGLSVLYFTASTLAGRLLYPLAPLYAAALVTGFFAWGRRRGVALVGLMLATYITLAVVMLRDVAALADGPWHIAL